MLTIDGSTGGGQLLRTALSLAVVTDTAFRMERIRESRPNPGLAAQHLAAVDLVTDLCDGDVEGAELGSDALTFCPGSARRSSLTADIGTAGSVTLLFDTVLPIAAVSDHSLELTATGGTNVKWAPTIEYHQLVKLPLLATFGLQATIDLIETGFYPAGGGEARLSTSPSSLAPLDLETRGALDRVAVHSKAAETLEDRKVAKRQAVHARQELETAGFDPAVETVEYVSSASTGSSLLVRGEYERTTVGFDALGARGQPSEDVATDAVSRFEAFHESAAAVDPFMGDQLVVFLALAGGRVRIPTTTDHVRTNLALVEAFDREIRVDRGPDGTYRLEASRSSRLG